jgi:hypothetical protein
VSRWNRSHFRHDIFWIKSPSTTLCTEPCPPGFAAPAEGSKTYRSLSLSSVTDRGSKGIGRRCKMSERSSGAAIPRMGCGPPVADVQMGCTTHDRNCRGERWEGSIRLDRWALGRVCVPQFTRSLSADSSPDSFLRLWTSWYELIGHCAEADAGSKGRGISWVSVSRLRVGNYQKEPEEIDEKVEGRRRSFYMRSGGRSLCEGARMT